MELHIITGPANSTTRGQHIIDAATLPNPHDVPKLRPRNGQDPMVRCWILDHPETQTLIAQEMQHILDAGNELVTVTCNAGWHRSVTVGDELARRLRAHGITTTVEHQGIEQRTKKKTSERGYGWAHQKQRDRLLYNHTDGSPCWWCGLPMYRDKTKNWDGNPLAADHDERDGAKQGSRASRLLHGNCNGQAQGHENDHRRPAVTGLHPSAPLPPTAQIGTVPSTSVDAGPSFTWA